jgi:hypothetical protein
MAESTPHSRTVQLDKKEREHLEDVVTAMRERCESNIGYQLRQEHGLDRRPDGDSDVSEERARLIEAIDLEAVDGHDWEEALSQYVTGVGYTIVNRLAALRCMEVRGFLDEEVTVFREDGLTPAADTLVYEEFLPEDEAVLKAYHEACDELAEEIEILFNRSTAYSLVDPDDDTFEELCGMLDEVADEVWRADDVLGWVYEYYNVDKLDDLRRKGDRVGLEPEDVPAANQFYTPHWVVRMLTDNSLGKLYLEHTGELGSVVEAQQSLSPDERKERSPAIADSPDLADLCTYLVPGEAGEPPTFDGPADIRVIDPACGSGHFLLYAFDVLERIWRAERPDLDRSEIPTRILQHNLHGVDLDMRACQLAAFNLYLKARTRTEAAGSEDFSMPEVGIVCADAKIADVESATEVFEEVAGDHPAVRNALGTILDAFEDIHGLGSLLDVRGTLAEEFTEGTQLTFGDSYEREHSLHGFLRSLREAIAERRDGDSFLAQDLRSFVRLLDVLSQEYDVALMNPPYGSQNRMPDSVQNYVTENYRYSAEYYINFFEVCNRISKKCGRIGMLIPRTFMTRTRFKEFRQDFIGTEGSFDFLAEFGIGVLDNATVRTAGTIVRSGERGRQSGVFLRLHDIATTEKESTLSKILTNEENRPKRLFEINVTEFEKVPRASLCYSTPEAVRDLHESEIKIDAERGGMQAESACQALLGILTGDKNRFYRRFWEIENFSVFKPIASGGSEAWISPQVRSTVEWGEEGKIVKRSPRMTRTANEEAYGKEGLTWTYVKESGRRFGYYPSGGLFSTKGPLLIPRDDKSLWQMMAVLNSDLYLALFISQTIEREWNTGEVGSLPWLEELAEIDELEELAKAQYRTKLSQRLTEPVSPYYVGPALLPTDRAEFFYDHPHTDATTDHLTGAFETSRPNQSITERARESAKRDLEHRQRLEALADRIDGLVYDALDIPQATREDIRTEIFLRTSENPADRAVPGPETVPEIPESTGERVKSLVHHFALRALRADEDGVIPVESVADEPSLHELIIKEFHATYGEHAPDRLVEADGILGEQRADEEAYPNLRRFIAEDLFSFHVTTMENTPIIWKLTTERLVSDPVGEGFGCLVDYHQLDAGVFDRIATRYLEPRKAALRDRRNAANRRRSDESLSSTERSAATEEYDRCVSALEQIEVFEDVMQELGRTTEREWSAENQRRAADLAPKVEKFRERTQARLDILDRLLELTDEAWFEDTFTPSFLDKIEKKREEWIDALKDLETACEAYTRDADEPVEAHRYDLFSYADDLLGSDHYSSSGILFATYYYETGGQYLDDGQPREGLQDEEITLLAELAVGLDEYKQLAEEITDECEELAGDIDADWADRALAEITTAGYRPNHKHGVEINITPLAEAEIVPETVEKKVI